MNIFLLPGSMILIGAALYAYGSKPQDPLSVSLVSPRALIAIGGTLFIFGFCILAALYFRGA